MFKESQQGENSSNSIVGSGSLAQKGNFIAALKVKKENLSPWIIDLGAFDHMIGDTTIFQNYTPCFGDYTVHIADGSLSKVVGKSFVVISKDLTLNSILLVPNLDCNLLSISKITQEKNCVTKFFLNLEFWEGDWQY